MPAGQYVSATATGPGGARPSSRSRCSSSPTCRRGADGHRRQPTADGAVGSLRDAIDEANTNGSASTTIELAAGTYTLTDALLGQLVIHNATDLPGEKQTIVGKS